MVTFQMKTVQLVIGNSQYAQALHNLLSRDGAHQVLLVDRPDLNLDGVVVVDESWFEPLLALNLEPERLVVITKKGTDRLSQVWEPAFGTSCLRGIHRVPPN